MVGINLKHAREILNALIGHIQLLVGTSSHIVRSSIVLVQTHQIVAIVNRLLKLTLLKITRGPYKQCFSMIWIFIQFLGTHWYQVIYVQCLPIDVRWPEKYLRLLIVCHHRRFGLRQASDFSVYVCAVLIRLFLLDGLLRFILVHRVFILLFLQHLPLWWHICSSNDPWHLLGSRLFLLMFFKFLL